MSGTYTTSWEFINDGDTTTIDPRNLVGKQNINILNAYIQWEGSQASSSSTSTSYNTNKNTVSATATTATDTDYNENKETTQLTSGENGFASTSFPSVPSGYSFDYHKLETNIILGSGGDDTDLSSAYGDVGGRQQSNTGSLNYSGTVSTNKVGDNRGVQTNEATDGFVTLEVITRTYGTDTDVLNDVSSTSYPSVPSGYNFNRHYYKKEKNGSTQEDSYSYSNQVGDSKSVTSTNTSNTWELTMKTRGSDSNTTTTYYDTKDPSVNGDVSGSYSGTLNDGSTSGWQTLSNLTATTTSIDHSISKSNEAQYQIKFDWGESRPISVATYRVKIGTTIYEVALADPDDKQLDYDALRCQVDDHGVLVFDAVDPSDPDAIPYYFQHPTHGKLALRGKPK